MEIETVKKLIRKIMRQRSSDVGRTRKSELYYENRNDILRQRNPLAEKLEKQQDPANPMRNADNRISHPWHQLLLDQKAAYTMTVPPLFDVDDEKMNDEIVKLLGDRYANIAKDLCVKAGNAGVAWLHVWIDEKTRFFKYAIVDSKQIIPIYSKRLDKELIGVMRVYEEYDEAGDTLQVYEIWNERECQTYSKKKAAIFDEIKEHQMFSEIDLSTGEIVGASNAFKHDWGKVPFIPFRNNPSEMRDLTRYKKLIDVYDKVYSGFVNDLDDVQEIIFVLTNYGGQDKETFLSDLKKYKMVKVDDDGDAKSGVNTLAIDIPIEARAKILEITREAIFTHGQGVDPQKNIGQNNSGAALKYMYSLLELKASMLETEFRAGFAELIRFILKYENHDADVTVKQTWTRSAINNDLELADIVAKLAPNTSQENIAKSNPLVEDWETEIANLEKEKAQDFRAQDDYRTDEKLNLNGDEADE
ncbi:phage portal protein [Enterococcus timonensis]|uniref:phage portal protein n=1 Tax=Enterococcus timonensis TaxID=1852364 RepID=UPI0008D91B2D|nr:phage portal protein [Enterococcus timonensis]